MASSSSGARTLPLWIIGSPSASWRKTSQTRSCGGEPSLMAWSARLRRRRSELPAARDIDRQDLLAELLVALGLDLPDEVSVRRRIGGRSVHLHEGAPPSV